MDLNNIKQKFKKHLPSWLFIFVVIVYRVINPAKETVFIYPSDGCWVGYNFTTKDKRYYPYIKAAVQIITQNQKKIGSKYIYPGVVEVESGDVVIDVGAFVGEFSLNVQEDAEKVFCCEPSPRSVHCLQKNTKNVSNITSISTLTGDTNELRSLNLGKDPTDNSILNIDEGNAVGEVTIYSMTIDRLIDELDIDNIDFLKIDAEGAEPEVIRGLNSSRVEKLSVDCGAERYGDTTVNEVKQLLNKRGYKTYNKNEHVFAHLDSKFK